jgi:hypothetical protein
MAFRLRIPKQAPDPPPRQAQRRRRPGARPGRYYAVAGLDLKAEMERLCRLPALGGPDGPLVRRPPELAVRRASKRPRSRLGFAVPEENRLSVTAYPGIRRGDVEETLLHELVHLAIGSSPGGRRWHGREFTTTLRRAMREAYGITGVKAANTYHGTYAEALERRHAREAALAARGVHPQQLELAG